MAEGDRQHARGQRIQRAAMPRLLRVETSADPVYNVGTCEPLRLVDDQPPIERATAFAAHEHSECLGKPPSNETGTGRPARAGGPSRVVRYLTVMAAGADGMPLATTSSVLAPASAAAGTSKFVVMICDPVATPMLL